MSKEPPDMLDAAIAVLAAVGVMTLLGIIVYATILVML